MTLKSRWFVGCGAIAVGLTAGLGCSSTPPPLWATGGAPLEFGQAVWTQIDGTQVYLDEQGRVLFDGDLVMMLDRVGRVVDESNDPVALLDDDGQLFGTNQTYLGRVGLHNASPPWGPQAWMRVTDEGSVVLFDTDGGSVDGGRWTGCEGPVLRACTLLTHLLLLESVQRPARRPAYYAPYPSWYGPYPYWGMGFGFYY